MTALVSNPVFQDQAAFRALMDAFAAPGAVKTLAGLAAPMPLSPATAAIIHSLADFETPVWLDSVLSVASVVDWIRFHTGAPIVNDRQAASFALIGDPEKLSDFSDFSIGTADYPDRSCTIVLQLDSLGEGDGLTLEGPGIEQARQLRVAPLPPGFVSRWAGNRESFPQGVDLVLVAGRDIAGLPRSVRIAGGC